MRGNTYISFFPRVSLESSLEVLPQPQKRELGVHTISSGKDRLQNCTFFFFLPIHLQMAELSKKVKWDLIWHFQRGVPWMLIESCGQKHVPQLQSKVDDGQFHPCLSILRLLTPGMWKAVCISLEDSPIPSTCHVIKALDSLSLPHWGILVPRWWSNSRRG